MKYWNAAVAVAGATCAFLFGGWTLLMQILLVMVSADYATGFIASAIQGRLKSTIGYKGIAKKVLIFVMVAVAHYVDKAIGQGNMVRDAVLFFYIWNELLSILENVGSAGIPIPDVIKRAIEILKNKGSGDGHG